MKVIDSLESLTRPCAFVPTMGALHAGHESLIKIARSYCEEVVVSVFVNPLQFEDSEDLAKYPKTPERDEEIARAAGATILWRPAPQQIYPGTEERISAGKLGSIFEGVNRGGHFDGVLTVVNRLFEMVRPRYAIFGEKDFQQLFLVRKMAAERHPELEIIAAPTIREESGLALSSRNVRLTDEGRNASLQISRALLTATLRSDLNLMKEALSELKFAPELKLDYAEIIDEDTFEFATADTAKKRAIVAGWIDGIRLIDNMALQPELARV